MSQDRECRADQAPEIAAPALEYLPRDPEAYSPAIGLIGCGGITPYHLRAYKAAGYRVTALCDVNRERAEERRLEFYPDAAIYTDYEELLQMANVEVVDVATHPAQRVPIIEAALAARKHVLSQKPFVLDLDEGNRLADLAESCGVKLAVNQNGRWAPHFSYIRQAVNASILGLVNGVNLSVHWDHTWTATTPFNELRHLILYDFAVHWCDILACFMRDQQPLRLFASVARTPTQPTRPPMLASIVVEYERALASLTFHGHAPFGAVDRTVVVGELGTAMSSGPDLNTQTVTITTKDGRATPDLIGDWFSNGFHGSMAELLCAVEENREPANSARDNLRGLAICFAAIASADSGLPVVPGRAIRITP